MNAILRGLEQTWQGVKNNGMYFTSDIFFTITVFYAKAPYCLDPSRGKMLQKKTTLESKNMT